MKLNNTEVDLLLAIITGNTDELKQGERIEQAKENLISKGYLRINEHRILELNISDNYFKQRGYHNIHDYEQSL